MAPVESVFQLSDLATGLLPPRPLAVLGDPIVHSLSPQMHNAALREMGEAFREWSYLRLQIRAEEMQDALPQLHALGFQGLNLTLPHKVKAVEWIEEVDPEGSAMGAVNTLIRTPTGYRGTNTDGYGIARAVEAAFGHGLSTGPVVLCGAGGAARAIAVEALRAGVPELWIGNRGKNNLHQLLQRLAENGQDVSRIRSFLFHAIPAEIPQDCLLINATAAGLGADDTLPIDLSFLGSKARIMDTTYGVVNAWSCFARKNGLSYSDGLPMLVHQGVRSLEIWTERKVSAKVMERAAREALARRS